MKTYRGQCHCGAVAFEADLDLQDATECNCSICTKKGAVHHRVDPAHFRLLSGKKSLILYQSGTKVAKHWFCRTCGMHPFGNPRAAPDKVIVNLRCLDDYWELIGQVKVRMFDGRDWDEAVNGFAFE